MRSTLMATDDDDDVQIVSIDGQPVEFNCEICHVSLTTKSVLERQAHYDEHLNQHSTRRDSRIIDLSSSGESIQGGGTLLNLKKRVDKNPRSDMDKQNIFWYPPLDTPPPPNFTPGLIHLLKQVLLTSHSKGRTVRAVLCYEGAVHVGSEGWEMGWGCGYRNFLMACTALMAQQVQPLYFSALDQPSPPGVRNLQHWIEDAWQAGFDPEGAADLKGKLVGTSKWIGTAELHTAFLSRGIPSRLVDFPNVESCAIAVLHWIVRYFSDASHDARELRSLAKVKTTVDEALRGASPVVVTDRMPLILQHKGHSRTIVGYERTKDGSINLLCFDPSRRPSSLIRNAALECFRSSRTWDHITGLSPKKNEKKPHHHSISPSRIINSVFHPRSNRENEASGSPLVNKKRVSDDDDGRDSKRPRGGLRGPGEPSIANREVIEISDDEDAAQVEQPQTPKAPSTEKTPAQEIDYAKVLEQFRLRPKKVGKNDRYQILYFPLDNLLTVEERQARKIVTADVVK